MPYLTLLPYEAHGDLSHPNRISLVRAREPGGHLITGSRGQQVLVTAEFPRLGLPLVWSVQHIPPPPTQGAPAIPTLNHKPIPTAPDRLLVKDGDRLRLSTSSPALIFTQTTSPNRSKNRPTVATPVPAANAIVIATDTGVIHKLPFYFRHHVAEITSSGLLLVGGEKKTLLFLNGSHHPLPLHHQRPLVPGDTITHRFVVPQYVTIPTSNGPRRRQTGARAETLVYRYQETEAP